MGRDVLYETNIGEKMEAQRKAAGYTVAEMARMLNMTIIQYSNYEKGFNNPSWKSIELFAQKLNVSIGQLFNTKKDALYAEKQIREHHDFHLTEQERSLLTKYRFLNEIGREEAEKRVAELAYIPMYSDSDYSLDKDFVFIKQEGK